MGWLSGAKKASPGGSGDKYAAPEDGNEAATAHAHPYHPPSSDVGGASVSVSDDASVMSSDAERRMNRMNLASASGSSSSSILWAPSGSGSILGDMRQDSFASFADDGATPRGSTSSAAGGGGGGSLTSSRRGCTSQMQLPHSLRSAWFGDSTLEPIKCGFLVSRQLHMQLVQLRRG
jgi:hypothetical protein